jgi:deoxyribodipyrimidine photolyase
LTLQAAAHKEEIYALREKLLGEATDAAATLTAERLRKLDQALSDRAIRLLQDNIRLKAELKVHADVSSRLSSRLVVS